MKGSVFCASPEEANFGASALPAENMPEFFQRALNCIDSRLAGHGKQVAYMTSCMVSVHGGVEPPQVREICLLALLQDMGVCKAPNEADSIFKTGQSVSSRHAIYGEILYRLVIKSPLAQAIRYHHTPYDHLEGVDRDIVFLAQMLQIADRASVIANQYGCTSADLDAYLLGGCGTLFSQDMVSLFRSTDFTYDICHRVKTGVEFGEIFNGPYFTTEEAEVYLSLFATAADFQSENTATHTAVRQMLSTQLAESLAFSNRLQRQVQQGAFLYGLGQLAGVPPVAGSVEARQQKAHSEQLKNLRPLLEGLAEDAVLGCACNPHGQLDSQGNWQPAQAAHLNEGERVVALAAEVAALYCPGKGAEAQKASILATLSVAVQHGWQDEAVFGAFSAQYDTVMPPCEAACAAAAENYEQVQKEYEAALLTIVAE